MGEKECGASQPRSRISEEEVTTEHSFDSSELWMVARQEVAGLRMSCLEKGASPILNLLESPVFVDNPDALGNLMTEMFRARLVAIDTEWYIPSENIAAREDTNPRAALSTLQLAIWNDNNRSLAAYVIDLMHESPADINREYHELTQNLVRNLLEACKDVPNRELPLVLGFAIQHDLPMLQEFLEDVKCDETGSCSSQDVLLGPAARRNRFCYPRVLDLQSVFATDNIKMKQQQQSKGSRSTTSNLPGLKACVARYTSVPLSKDCQCSDWGRRPLSGAQLDYAGLDAAVLLVLLAERSMEETQQSKRGG